MPRTALSRRSAALLLAASLATLSACGGSDDDGGGSAASSSSESSPASSSAADDSGSASSSSAPADEQGGTLTVTGVDFEFEMDSTDLSAGEYEVTFANEGGSTHNVVVERDGEDVEASDTIGPGESTTFTVSLEPGEYVFYCGVGNHRAMGMETTVTVT